MGTTFGFALPPWQPAPGTPLMSDHINYEHIYNSSIEVWISYQISLNVCD